MKSRRWTEEDLDRVLNLHQIPAQVKVPKYRNMAVQVGSMRFDSKLEYRCWQWLELRKGAGEVLWVIRQVPFELEGGVRYRADFLAVLASGGVEVLDAKGKDTQSSINKRKQVLERYGVEVQLWPTNEREREFAKRFAHMRNQE